MVWYIPMKILGIETSCDETAAAVLDVALDETFSVLSNVISSQVELHAQYGGVVPHLASREHAKNIGHVVNQALTDAHATIKDIDLIAITHGPGLGPALVVGITFAKTLAWQNEKAIVGVNHMAGHIHSNWLGSTKLLADIFPALNVIVSGGHAELVIMKDHGTYEIIGETLDDAIGEAFDKVARLLGLGYPGGLAISKLAQQGNPETFNLPRPMAHSKDYNFSYSGLKTSVLYLIRDLTHGQGAEKLTEQQKADIAASFQTAAIDTILTKAKRVTENFEVRSVLLSGGVSANLLLRQRLSGMAQDLGIDYFQPEMKYTTDNAAMIAAAGYFAFKKEPASTWSSITMDANLSL